jgi:hypothetical protein
MNSEHYNQRPATIDSNNMHPCTIRHIIDSNQGIRAPNLIKLVRAPHRTGVSTELGTSVAADRQRPRRDGARVRRRAGGPPPSSDGRGMRLLRAAAAGG